MFGLNSEKIKRLLMDMDGADKVMQTLEA